MDKHTFHKTSPQLLKFKKGLGFQLYNEQLQADDGKHKVELELHPLDTKKLIEAIKKKKGFRFGKQNIQSGSILSKIGNTVKKIVPKSLVKSALTMGEDALGFLETGTPISD